MQHHKTTLLSLIILISSSTLLASEVELFIPNERAKEILQEENNIKLQQRKAQYKKLQNRITSQLQIHENTELPEAIHKNNKAIIIDDSNNIAKKNTNTISVKRITPAIHENTEKKLTRENNLYLTKTTKNIKRNNVHIHENKIELSNFIVHENNFKGRYNKGIDKILIPNKRKIWTAAASQATLLFGPSAQDRDQAIRKLINNGGWFRVAKKLLASDNNKTRISGIQIIKLAITNPKYSNVADTIKIKKLSPLLSKTLNDSDSKVRFISAIILNNLLGKDFNYNYNSDIQSRKNVIAKLNNFVQIKYGS